MFRFSTIIREPAMTLPKVMFILKHSLRLPRNSTEFFNITLASFIGSSLMMVEDRNM